jgi:hypothetical protein
MSITSTMVHLFAWGCLARIFPHRSAAVGEEPFAVVVTQRRCASEDLLQEWSLLVVATYDAGLAAEDVRHEWAFELGIRGVGRDEAVDVVSSERLLPSTSDRFDFLSRHRVHARAYAHTPNVRHDSSVTRDLRAKPGDVSTASP